MRVAATVILGLWPILLVIVLFALAVWRDHRRESMAARQIWLTDALAEELGQIVAPVVAKPLARPWRVAIRVPVHRPATVSRIVAIAHEALTRSGAGRYELVLSPEPARRRGRSLASAARLRGLAIGSPVKGAAQPRCQTPAATVLLIGARPPRADGRYAGSVRVMSPRSTA